MKFIVERTSIWDDAQPIEGTKKESIPNWDKRTCTEEYYNKHIAGTFGNETKWREKGTEHSKPTKNTIKRRLPDDITVWTIEINSLEEIMELAKINDIIIKTSNIFCYDLPVIEIYDSYRE